MVKIIGDKQVVPPTGFSKFPEWRRFHILRVLNCGLGNFRIQPQMK